MTTTYTRDQLTTREMTKPKLQNIAAGLEIEFEPSDTKAQLIDWILFAQGQVEDQVESDDEEDFEQMAIATDDDSEAAVEVEVEEVAPPEPELEAEEQKSDLTYEQRLILYLDENANVGSCAEATYLLENFGAFKQLLTAIAIAQPAKTRRGGTPRTGTPRITDPAEKLAQAREVYEAVVRCNGDTKAAGETVGKSAHYTKVIAKAYELYEASSKIRTAYDAGELNWTELYNLAFSFKKADTVETAEARMSA
ncbi:hypothetical protein H6G00_01075 [Leptolyngbya sp. FACHB-541]|uniref:hypothetical protein n=1 Tax=Leptolyngbya sp. FACHB-541 TaxID=2692810 RepID=UPI0016832C2B|nr:hypothetical protein [Leptolyngbya sp. FACHB-541]MBD1995221.1 hypothetical protein [Leptolyngbya sp. FACHB-541]